jgi:RNA-binding protein
MSLSPKSRQHLKAQAHSLKPIVTIGQNGLTAAVHKELDSALSFHELMKVKLQIKERELRRQILDEICQTQAAEFVQLIGNVGVIYRKNPEK